MYFLLVVDDFSRLMWVSMLKLKSDALREFKHFKALVEAKKKANKFNVYDQTEEESLPQQTS